ncbi:MAG: FAD-dependent oxidoreductase [Proteobacteria bacterium]|nr:FAD-dependent oxidoreductase [Pseudomonadota bacterium]
MKSVIIVGAGVVGLMCAARLAKAGARVTVLEAHDENTTVWGPTASASAAGMLSPLTEGSSPHQGLALRSLDLWRAWRNGSAWADAVRFDGGVVAGAKAANVLERAQAAGREAQLLSVGAFRKRTGFAAEVEGSVFLADEGFADPLRTLSGLVMDARAHGVLVNFKQDVLDLTANKVGTYLGATFEADIVVLTPGVWTIEKMIDMAPALRLVRPAKGCLVPVNLNHGLAPSLHGSGFYLAQQRDQVVLGSTMDFDRTDRSIDPTQVEGLFAAADALLPGEVRLTPKPWTGIRPMSPDGWPMIGPSGDVLIAAGHSRNGWLLAPITAEIITAYVMGSAIPPEWAALSPDRFGQA